jgi:hypothetical protein
MWETHPAGNDPQGIDYGIAGDPDALRVHAFRYFQLRSKLLGHGETENQGHLINWRGAA